MKVIVGPENETVVGQQTKIDVSELPKRQDGQTVEEWVEEAAHWAQQQVDKGASSNLLGS